jgi:predicted RNA methylase
VVALRAALIEQGDPEIGQELICVTHPDGSIEELRLHEYERLYALPGVYEQIVQERLGCVSPAKIASLLAAAVDGVGWARADVRVIDVAAGNGVSGEALAAEGLHPVFGTDIVPAAREAALRDRPRLYDEYLTLDLLALTAEQARRLRSLRANALTCVAPVGEDASQVPPAAFLEAARAVTDDALVAYMHDPNHGVDDVITTELWHERLGAEATELARERYGHRQTVNGASFDMVGVVWRVRR